MAPVNRVKERLEAGETVFGTWLQTASPTVANILAHCGMDFVTVDMEHGPASFSEAEAVMYAVEAGGSTPMIRLGDGSAPERAEGLRRRLPGDPRSPRTDC